MTVLYFVGTTLVTAVAGFGLLLIPDDRRQRAQAAKVDAHARCRGRFGLERCAVSRSDHSHSHHGRSGLEWFGDFQY
jgi:hypothetical protein